jgi:L-amino acid N-acyltransferase YncA
MPIEIRDARESDLPAVLAIHNHVIATSTANFSYHAVDLDDRRAFLRARQASGFPFLAAVEGNDLLGYASFGPFRPHDGYVRTVEHSIYVAPSHYRKGVATLLLPELIERGRAMGKHVMVGGLDAANEASIALHERFGFERVGLMPQVGFKFDRYLDLLWMQKRLDL